MADPAREATTARAFVARLLFGVWAGTTVGAIILTSAGVTRPEGSDPGLWWWWAVPAASAVLACLVWGSTRRIVRAGVPILVLAALLAIVSVVAGIAP